MGKSKSSVRPAATGSEPSARSGRWSLAPRWVYALGFVLLWVYAVVLWGDVWQHLANESYFSFEREPMTYVLRLDYGWVYWAARFLLLPFRWGWLGGTLMALVLTLVAFLFDGIHRWRRAWAGVGFLPVWGLLAYFVWCDYNLFLRAEPSLFIVQTLLLLLVAAVAALVGRLAVKEAPTPASRFTLWGGAVAVLAYAGVVWAALVPGENLRITSRLQNQLDCEDWASMVETARSAERPTRTIAALHALALSHQGQLLEGAFALPYDYPELHLEKNVGSDEGPAYMADCNLTAGLVNAAYRASLEYNVISGPRIRNFRRMAICALLNGERALAERYFHLIESMPFERDFLDHYRPMLADSTRISADERLAQILRVAPMEKRFEQNYRQPAFLGYNVGMMEGRDEGLVNSVAACLYSKDLDNTLMRVDVLRKRQSLPLSVLQAVAVASVKREGLLEHFPEVTEMVVQQMHSFVVEATPYLERINAAPEAEKTPIRREMADALREAWLGTYFYYYFCGNLVEAKGQAQGHGVN